MDQKTEFFCESCGVPLFVLHSVGKTFTKEQFRSYAEKPNGIFYCLNCYKVGKEPQKGKENEEEN